MRSRCSFAASAPLALLLSCALLTIPPRGARAHPVQDSSTRTKTRWTDEEIARDKWVWHLAQSARLGGKARAAAREVIFSDQRDMAVLQGDAITVASRNAFDLNGMRVTFTPSGGGYTVAAGSAAMSTNLGTKLDLTTSEAVNPKPEAEPGDDAYLLRDLGFTFPFYGSGYAQVGISANGNLVFRPAGIAQTAFDDGAVDSGESLVDLRDGLPRIAPYWHDLDARAATTRGTAGIYYRAEPDRVVVTYNNIRDFPNDTTDNGVHRFQVTLFQDGRIEFVYDTVQLTTRAVAGIGGGATKDTPVLVKLSRGSAAAISAPIAEVFSTNTTVDDFAVLDTFYATHRDLYDFVYLVTDFEADLGDAFAYYMRLRNSIQGIGLTDAEPGVGFSVASSRVQGLINLANIARYPNSPTTRFFGANHALSILGQEQGHRWGTFLKYPGSNPNVLVGRDDSHWSFFANSESNVSRPGVRRSSSMEGNVWLDNGNGTFTSASLIDGYSRYDHYVMGLRPAGEVPDTFVIANPGASVYTRTSGPRPGVTIRGTRLNVTINNVIQANGVRVPGSETAPKSFRAAWVLVTEPGTEASAVTIAKLFRYRLAWESYFAQATDYLGSLNAGLEDTAQSRAIAVTSAADYSPALAPAGIGSIFGSGLTAGGTESTPSVNLPTTLAGTQVTVDGIPARLFLASPEQINFQVPAGTVATTSSLSVNSSTALVEVFRGGELIRAGTFQVAPVSPSLFTVDSTGSGPAAALDAITFAPAPFNARQTNGDPNILALFGTGAGIDATDVDGNRAASFQATVDGSAAVLSYAGRAPGFPGLNQFNLVLPAGIRAGSHTVVLTRNGLPSNTVTVVIR